MPKDELIFGGLAGAVGNIIKEILTWSFYWVGMFKYTFIHFCAGIVLNSNSVKTPAGVAIGMVIDNFLAALFGVAIFYVLKRYGTSFLVLKALAFGLGIFLICYSMLRPTFSSIKENAEPLVSLLYLGPNLVYGITTGWFIKKYNRILH